MGLRVTKEKIEYRPAHAISYAEYGDKSGFPILIQHGLVASIDDDSLFHRLLGRKTRLISVARPGYGESSPFVIANFAEWSCVIAGLVEKLQLDRFDVLGISSGAPYAYSLGHGFPEKVRNIFIVSGVPALYDEVVLSDWPYEIARNAGIIEMEGLARRLFFSNLSENDMRRSDIRDSTMNNCFGVALDLQLRSRDWGFRLAGVKADVFMRHSRKDEAVPIATAIRTSTLLPHCVLDVVEDGPHFSEDALDEFIESTMAKHYAGHGSQDTE